MDMQNEQAWLKRMASRPDENPSLEAVHRMEVRLLQGIRRQRRVRKWVRVNAIAGAALVVIVLAVGLLSPGGQSILRNAASPASPSAGQAMDRDQRIKAFLQTLSPNDSLVGDDGKGTFAVLKDRRELLTETAGKRKTLMRAPSGAELQVMTGTNLRLAVRTQEKGKPDRLSLVNAATGVSVNVPLSGQKISVAVTQPNAEELVVLLDDAERSKQTVQCLNWTTGKAKTLQENDGRRFWNMYIDGQDTLVLDSPYKIVILRNGAWHTVAASENPEFHVLSTDQRLLYVQGAIPDMGSLGFYRSDSQVMTYDKDTGKSRAILPNVSGEQQLIWGPSKDDAYLIGAFHPLKKLEFASDQERHVQEGTLELWYVINGEAKKIHEEKTTWDQHYLMYNILNGKSYLYANDRPMKQRFLFDQKNGTIEPVAAVGK